MIILDNEGADFIAEDVRHDIEENANTEEFIEPEIIEGEVVETPKQEQPKQEQKQTKQTKPTQDDAPDWIPR